MAVQHTILLNPVMAVCLGERKGDEGLDQLRAFSNKEILKRKGINCSSHPLGKLLMDLRCSQRDSC